MKPGFPKKRLSIVTELDMSKGVVSKSDCSVSFIAIFPRCPYLVAAGLKTGSHHCLIDPSTATEPTDQVS
jgi:hypothetical protein